MKLSSAEEHLSDILDHFAPHHRRQIMVLTEYVNGLPPVFILVNRQRVPLVLNQVELVELGLGLLLDRLQRTLVLG